MADQELTEGGGMNQYLIEQRKLMGPRNTSPEVMGRYKAQVFGAIMSGGFTDDSELMAWDSYSSDKKKLLIGSFEKLDQVRFVLTREPDNDVLAYALAKKRELEIVAEAAGVAPK